GSGSREIPSSGGGGPSTVNDTMFCPRSKTNPNTRFSSRSTPLVPFPLIFRNSSHSDRIMFMCLSKALKVPMKVRLSCSMTLIRKLRYCIILLFLLIVYKVNIDSLVLSNLFIMYLPLLDLALIRVLSGLNEKKHKQRT